MGQRRCVPPEFDLVLACARWPASDAAGARIRELAQRRLRWPHFLEIVRHHEVAPLVSRAIGAWASDLVPAEILAALHGAAVENARFCFQRISELVRLLDAYEAEGIGVRVLKGAPLALFAFGDPTLRGAGDLDLLIDERDLSAADRILQREGYLRSEPAAPLTPRRLRSYIAYQKDFSYTNRQTGSAIDLHWRLFRNRRLPLNAGAGASGLAWAQIGSLSVPILPWDRTFLYLCVHGALDGWLRLKWLADIGALLNKFTAAELAGISQQAAAHDVLPEVSAALLLCEQKLGCDVKIPGLLGPEDRNVARIVHFADRLMAHNDYRPMRERVPSQAWFMNELLLHRSLGYRLEIVRRSLFRSRIWEKVNLPDSLFPLYAALSPIEWLGFRVQRAAEGLLAGLRRRRRAPRVRGGLVARFFALSPADAALLAEAALLLAFFRAALRFFPVQRLTAWMGVHASERQLPSEEETRRTIRRVQWAVGAVVRHSPMDFVCFPQSLAAYFMLRRRRVPSRLFYGVAREEQALTAHTWIKVGERMVVGGEAAPRFTVLAIFP